MIKSIGPRHENNVQYSIVEDITRDGAFDNVSGTRLPGYFEDTITYIWRTIGIEESSRD